MATADEINLRGFKFTMSDLAKRLSISKSSLYEHFSSKDELISTLIDIILHDFRSQEIKFYEADMPIIGKLKAVLTIQPQTFEPFPSRVYDDLRLTYPEEWKKVAAFQKDRMNRLGALLSEGMRNGTIRTVNLAVVQQMIISSTSDLIRYPFLSENNMTYPDAIAAMLDVIIYGLIAKK
jgi:AcrR family transcriptional regulator